MSLITVSSASPEDLTVLSVLALLRVEVGLEEQLGHTDHAVHRRADLVTHRRQELALGLVRLFGGVASAFAFGDIRHHADQLGRAQRRLHHAQRGAEPEFAAVGCLHAVFEVFGLARGERRRARRMKALTVLGIEPIDPERRSAVQRSIGNPSRTWASRLTKLQCVPSMFERHSTTCAASTSSCSRRSLCCAASACAEKRRSTSEVTIAMPSTTTVTPTIPAMPIAEIASE